MRVYNKRHGRDTGNKKSRVIHFHMYVECRSYRAELAYNLSNSSSTGAHVHMGVYFSQVHKKRNMSQWTVISSVSTLH